MSPPAPESPRVNSHDRRQNASGAGVCGRCKHPRRKGDRFCAHCGLQFEEALAERKFVTLLFADLCGSTAHVARADPEEAQGFLDRALKTMAEAVETYGGSVRRLQGDGLVGLFGAPIAQEDHALRACLAALAVQRRTREQGAGEPEASTQVRIGIHSGEVVVGSINDLLTSHHRLDGAAIHLAARLEQLAPPGGVLVSGATVRLLDGELESRVIGLRPIRGFDQPVELHELVLESQRSAAAPLAKRRHLSPLVGREAILTAMHAVASRVANGSMRVLGVRGDAGIGKSRVVARFCVDARTMGFDVCGMTTRSYTNHLPYSALADLMRALMGLREDIDPERERDMAREAVASWGEAAQRHVPAAMDLLDLGTLPPEWLALTPGQRRARIGEALLWLIAGRLTDGPLLIVVEDVFLADRDSLRMLEGLWRKLDELPVLLCVTYRQDFVHRWADPVWFEEVWVAPLTQRDMEALATSLLGRHESLNAVVPMLIERADGNPFFLEQMSLTLVDTGGLMGSPGDYRFQGTDAELRVPASIAAVIGARVDRLPAAAKSTLEGMAILGEVVTAETLAAMLGAPADEVDLHLRLGCASGLLMQTGAVMQGDRPVGEVDAASSTGASVAFRHALVQEVVAAALTRPRRKLLHQAAFTALVARLGDRANERASVLAHHAYQGGFWMDAARFCAAAMVRSVARSANRDALRMLDTGLDAAQRVDDEPTRLACELVLRSEALGALWPLGHFDAMFVHLERAQAITEQMGDPKRQAAVSLQMASLFWVRGKAAQGLVAAQAAKAAALWAGSRGAQMTAAQLELMLHHGLGRYAEVVQQARDVERDFAVELGGRRIMPGWATLPLINVKVFLADALARMGDTVAAQAVCDLAYRELQAQDHAFSRTLVDFAQTSLWLRQGLHAQAIPLLRETLVSCRQHDIHTMTPCIVGLLAEALGRAGASDEAQAMVEQALADKSYLLAGLYSEFYLRFGWGVACATAQQHAQALAQFSAAQAHAARYEQWGHEADALLAMAEVAASAGDTSVALLHLEAARKAARACGMQGVAQRAQALSGQLGRPARAAPLTELADD